MLTMAIRINIVVEENRNFHVTTNDDQLIRITQYLQYSPVIFTLMDEYTFQCTFSSLVKMIKFTLRKNTGNRDYLDANYRNILYNDLFFKTIHCEIFDFFELFDDYFRINGGTRVLNDIYLPYTFVLNRDKDCKENMMVRNIITNQKHPISEFKDISSASVWGFPKRGYSNVKMTEDLLKKMIKFNESRKKGIKVDNITVLYSKEYIFHQNNLRLAIKNCLIFNESMDSQRQGLIIPDYEYYIDNWRLLYFNHLDIVEGILRNYQ